MLRGITRDSFHVAHPAGVSLSRGEDENVLAPVDVHPDVAAVAARVHQPAGLVLALGDARGRPAALAVEPRERHRLPALARGERLGQTSAQPQS